MSEDSPISAFAELGLDPRITATLTALGYEAAPIERLTVVEADPVRRAA